jgi:hypothetical protein
MSQDIKTTSTDAPSASKTISVASFQTRLVNLLSAHRKQDATFYGDIVTLYDSLKDRDSTLPTALKLVEIDGRSLAKSTFLAWVQVGRFLATHAPHSPAFAMLSQASLRFLCTEEWTPEVVAMLYPLSEPELNARILAARRANKSDTTAPRVNAGKPTDTAGERVENATPPPAPTGPKPINLSPETLAMIERLRGLAPSDGDPLSIDALVMYACSQVVAKLSAKPLTMVAKG